MALKIDPKHADAWRFKGDTLAELGKCEDAIDCYDMALKIDPKNADAWGMKGIALYELRQYQAAIDSMRDRLSPPLVH